MIHICMCVTWEAKKTTCKAGGKMMERYINQYTNTDT